MNHIQSHTIRRRRAGSWRSLRAHSTTSDVEDVSTTRASRTNPRDTLYHISRTNKAPTQFEVLCSAFFQESASPLVPPPERHAPTLYSAVCSKAAVYRDYYAVYERGEVGVGEPEKCAVEVCGDSEAAHRRVGDYLVGASSQ